MHRNRLLWLAALLLAATGGLGGGVAAASGPDDPIVTLDREFTALAKAIPGFGGLFLDAEGRPTAYLTDPGDGRARSLLGEEVQVLRGDYEWRALARWSQALMSVFEDRRVVFLDIDETANRSRIGVEREAATKAAGAVAGRIDELGGLTVF